MKFISVIIALLSLTAAEVAAERRALLRGSSSSSSSKNDVDAVSPREQTCRMCYRQCPVACYVGTCGLNFGFESKRYGSSNQCYSCEPAAGVGFAETGDFLLCSAEEAAATQS